MTTRRDFIGLFATGLAGVYIAPDVVRTLWRRAQAEELTRPMGLWLVDAITGQAFNGIGARGFVSINGHAPEERLTRTLGDGFYAVDLTEADTDADGLLAVSIAAPGAIPMTVQLIVPWPVALPEF